MLSFRKTLRTRLPALSLCVFSAFAALPLLAPPASAQQKPAVESKGFVDAYKAAQTAQAAKDWNGVLANADVALPLAQSPQAKLAAEGLRMQAFANLGKKPELVKSIEAQLQMGGLPPETVKTYRGLQMSLYSEFNDDAKATELTKAYVKDYGGTADQYAFIASGALKQKDDAGALEYAQKSIDSSKQAGQKPRDAVYQIVMKAYFDQNDLPNYFAAIERAAADYPKPEYVRALIERAAKEPKFNRTGHYLDIQRALVAVKTELKPNELASMGENALSRGNAREAVAIFGDLDKGGWAGVDPTQTARYKTMYARAQADAKAGLASAAKDEQAAAAAAKGDLLVNTGDDALGAGDYQKAIDFIQKGIAKGGMSDGDLAFAKLQLGVAQFKTGKKDDAVRTWADVKSDNGAGALARDWTLIARM